MVTSLKLTFCQTPDNLILPKVEQIVKNTIPPTIAQQHIDYIALFIAIVALIVTIASLFFAMLTYRNTLSLRAITQKDKILRELIRHLYRNQVIIRAILRDLKDNIEHFPSEEHLLKIKFSEDGLYMSKFAGFFDNFDELHYLEVRIRNFNIEVDIALEHFKNESLEIAIKERELLALSSKIDSMANEIFILLSKRAPKKSENQKMDAIKQFLEGKSNKMDALQDNENNGFFENIFKDDEESVLQKDIQRQKINWLPHRPQTTPKNITS